MYGNNEAKTAKIAVWWEMFDCRIPDGYDARCVRPSIEHAFKKQGYSGPISITAYGDQKQTPDHILLGLTSTGVNVAHTTTKNTCSVMFSDMLEWRSHNPPPATIMLISDHVEDVFSWDLVRLQQHTQYNLCLAYSVKSCYASVLVTSVEWLWDTLLAASETRGRQVVSERGESSAGLFYCKSCFDDCEGLDNFIKHLSSEEHALEEDSIYSDIRRRESNREYWLEVNTFPNV